MENIGLQDSLLSRFDLLFIVLDQMDPEQDREISDHVLRMHRYRNPNEQDGDGELLLLCVSPEVNGFFLPVVASLLPGVRRDRTLVLNGMLVISLL